MPFMALKNAPLKINPEPSILALAEPSGWGAEGLTFEQRMDTS